MKKCRHKRLTDVKTTQTSANRVEALRNERETTTRSRRAHNAAAQKSCDEIAERAAVVAASAQQNDIWAATAQPLDRFDDAQLKNIIQNFFLSHSESVVLFYLRVQRAIAAVARLVDNRRARTRDKREMERKTRVRERAESLINAISERIDISMAAL